MNKIKFILVRLNTILFSLITFIGSITFVKGILTNTLVDEIFSMPTLAVLLGVVIGIISANYYVGSCIKEDT